MSGFRYKPRGDWFSFAKVRKLCFLCSCKQTRETSISHRRVCDVYVLLHPPERLPRMTVAEVRESVYNILNMYIFLTKTYRFTTGGLYSHPAAVWGTFYYGWMCFIWLLLDCWKKHPSTPILNAWKSKDNFNITLIGFVWNKKVIYTQDALRVSKKLTNFHFGVN